MARLFANLIEWVRTVDPAKLEWSVAVLLALFFGLVLLGLVQYQAFNRQWGLKLVLGLAGGALVVGLGAAIHWFLGVLYGLGYLLTWLAWVLTRRWRGWRQRLARGLAAAVCLGPWLWYGATETAILADRSGTWKCKGIQWQVDEGRSGEIADEVVWLLPVAGYRVGALVSGMAWLGVLAAGWACWQGQGPQPRRARRWSVVALWGLTSLAGVNWYLAGRVDLFGAAETGRRSRLGYALLSRPGSAWHRDPWGRTPLHWAVRAGHTGAMRLLLATGAGVNAKERDGSTPLHWAIREGRPAPIRLLLAAGADANARDNYGVTPVHQAAACGQTGVLRLLLAAGGEVNAKDHVGDNPLHRAAWSGNADTIRLLLAAGAEVMTQNREGSTPLHRAAGSGHADQIRLLLAAGAGVKAKAEDRGTPLHAAVQSGNAEAVRLLLAAGADVMAADKEGRTPLHRAAGAEAHGGKGGPGQPARNEAIRRGHAEAVRLLLAAGVEVNAKDQYGETPLQAAAQSGNAEVVRLLLAAGGDVNAKDQRGETPLHQAAGRGHADALQLLLAAGAMVNPKNDGGWTPLHGAPFSRAADVVRLLLAAGAEVNARNRTGWTPLHVAAGCGRPEAIRLLLAAAAAVNTKEEECGWTPLHVAAGAHASHTVYARWKPMSEWVANGQRDAIRLLLGAGAEVNAKDKDGRTPLDWMALAAADEAPPLLEVITKTERQASMALLRQAGGKPGKELGAARPAP